MNEYEYPILGTMRCVMIRVSEVEDALKKMTKEKSVGPDGIPIEVWNCLGENGVLWLTKLFNEI